MSAAPEHAINAPTAGARYAFGASPTRCVNAFAFPRTGSHLFRYATWGLFDLVSPPLGGEANPEAIARRDELDPDALYALSLREDGVPFSPVWIDMEPPLKGRHADPFPSARPAVVLARDASAAVYSLWRVGFERWGWERPRDEAAWVGRKFARYHAFILAARALVESRPGDTLLLRYEELAGIEGPERTIAALERLVRFVGARPKLGPRFVASVIRFDRLTRPGERSFHRAGDNEAWTRDARFVELLAGAGPLPDFSWLGRAGLAAAGPAHG